MRGRNSQRKFAEIRLRACIKIGEISQELEKAQTLGKGGQVRLPSDGKSKAEQLAQAGIATSTAQRYEELSGGREEQAQEIATQAADVYFATQEQSGEPVSMGGLKTAIRQALVKSFGERPARPCQ